MNNELSEVNTETVTHQLSSDPSRNLALKLVRVTETTTITTKRHMGRGDKELVDQAAVDAMRPVLQSMQIDRIVVIGENEKDETPMLYNSERVGSDMPPEVNLTIDPIDSTTLTTKSLPDAIAVITITKQNTMFDPNPCVYIKKLTITKDMADIVDLDASIADNLRRIAKRHGKRADNVTIAVLEHPRHEDLVTEILATKTRVKFLRDSDITDAILTADETSTVDACMSIGGTPKNVIATCALQCLDNLILKQLYPRNDTERNAALEQNYDLDQMLRTEDLVSKQNIFFATTDVTKSELLQKIRYSPRRIVTKSLSMRSKSDAVRIVENHHHPERSNLIRTNST